MNEKGSFFTHGERFKSNKFRGLKRDLGNAVSENQGYLLRWGVPITVGLIVLSLVIHEANKLLKDKQNNS
jgi:hypothetical protein